MKKTYYIICYQYYDSKKKVTVKGNDYISEENMEIERYYNPIDSIIRKMSRLQYEEDVVILSVSKIEMTEME